MGLETLALVGAVAGGASAVVGTIQQNRYAKRSANAQREQQQTSARHERMQAIRQAQLQRAAATMTSIGSGSNDSSGAAGGIGSISSQLGTNMGYASQMTNLSGVIGQSATRQSMWGGVAGIGSSLFKMSGGFGAMGFGPQANVGPQGNYYPRTGLEGTR